MAEVEEQMKRRKTNASKVTRTINELLNAVKIVAAKDELIEKIEHVKSAIGSLGEVHDSIINLIPDEDKALVEEQFKWYNDYDLKATLAIKEARNLIESFHPTQKKQLTAQLDPHVKLAKLEIPKFASDYRNYLKWKSQFERYTRHCDDEVKYDYLYTNTQGAAHRIVTGTQKYQDAIFKLKEFGDVNYTLKLLIDDIRALNLVKKGDHSSFINLSHEVNKFKDRLEDLGKSKEVLNFRRFP